MLPSGCPNHTNRDIKAGQRNLSFLDDVHPHSVLEKAASFFGDQTILEDLLRYSWTRKAKWRALTVSLRDGRSDLAKILLWSNADINQRIRKYRDLLRWWDDAPLLIAVNRQDLSLIRTLIAVGCDVNFIINPSKGATTILGKAIREGDVDIVKSLLVAGAMVNQPCGSTNALNIYIEKERLDLAVLLLDAGAEINNPPHPYHGRTALQVAVEKGNLQLIEFHLLSGADVNQEPAHKAGATALQLASIQGYIGIARKLIDLGANVNALGACIHSRTALGGAAEHGPIDTVRLLLETGASVEGPACKQCWRLMRQQSF